MKKYLLLLASLLAVAGCGVVVPSSTQSSKTKTLKIVSYNVGVFNKAKSGVLSLKPCAELVRELDPDMIAVQELDSCALRTRQVNEPYEFAKALGHWKFNFTKTFTKKKDGGAYGIASFVKGKYKVEKAYKVTLPKFGGPEVRACSVIETKDFVIASTHLNHKVVSSRVSQAEVLIKWMNEKYGDSSKPVFLCGDFNTKPDSKVMDMFRQYWTILSDTGVYTHPCSSTKPAKQCIDYIMVLNNKAKVRVLRSGVVNRSDKFDLPTLSDHFPIWVEAEITL